MLSIEIFHSQQSGIFIISDCTWSKSVCYFYQIVYTVPFNKFISAGSILSIYANNILVLSFLGIIITSPSLKYGFASCSLSHKILVDLHAHVSHLFFLNYITCRLLILYFSILFFYLPINFAVLFESDCLLNDFIHSICARAVNVPGFKIALKL